MNGKTASALKKLAAAGLIVLMLLATLFFYTAVRLNTKTGKAEALLRGRIEKRQEVFSAAIEAWKESGRHGQNGTAVSLKQAPEILKSAASPLKAGDIMAEAAIVIDAATGTVLFEKNADEVIPPASMTKVVSMYTAFKLMDERGISMNQKAELPAESWAVNIPPGSSLMFLAEDQRVTMKELFEGMSVASGNDAAIAVACNVSGSVQSFMEEVNEEMARLGLIQTRFVEPSGLSEYNRTTAREFALFSKIYIEEYPEALRDFHSIRSMAYPKIWNLPEYSAKTAAADQDGNTSQTIKQLATNRLLGTMEGCDGLKTGFIEESGYNFSVTCRRGNTRFIAVLMGGPGKTSAEGSRIRSEDGRKILEWAFANFRTFRPVSPEPSVVTLWGSKDGYATVIPAEEAVFTVTAADSNSKAVSAGAIDFSGADSFMSIEMKENLRLPVAAGEVVGRAVWYSPSGAEIGGIDLISAETEEQGNGLKRAADFLSKKCAEILGKI